MLSYIRADYQSYSLELGKSGQNSWYLLRVGHAYFGPYICPIVHEKGVSLILLYFPIQSTCFLGCWIVSVSLQMSSYLIG